MNYQRFQKFNNIDRLVHGFTYRNGEGVPLPFGNQHMGLLSFHYQNEAWENIKSLAREISPKIKQIVVTEQIHDVLLASYPDMPFEHHEKDGFILDIYRGTDGVFTTSEDVLLLTFYADCTPLFFVDPLKRVIGMAHSGWKGTEKKIGLKSLKFLEVQYQSNLSEVLAVVGPSAGKCCYEVDENVRSKFSDADQYFQATSPGHYKMDLKAINGAILLNGGIHSGNLEVAGDCTLCQTDQYFSHRRENGDTGRMAGFMCLLSEEF